MSAVGRQISSVLLLTPMGMNHGISQSEWATQPEGATQLEAFRTLLNDLKANLDMIGEDAAAKSGWTGSPPLARQYPCSEPLR